MRDGLCRFSCNAAREVWRHQEVKLQFDTQDFAVKDLKASTPVRSHFWKGVSVEWLRLGHSKWLKIEIYSQYKKHKVS